MNILVTGCTGFIGLALCDYLLRKDHNVIGLCRNVKNPRLENFLSNNNFYVYEAELSILSHSNTIDFTGGIDAIVHTAAQSPYNYESSNDYITNNIIATQKLIDFAIANSIAKFIFTSSISIYGDIFDGIVDEMTVIREPDIYGTSKLFCEKILQENVEQINSLAIRLPGVVGNGAHSPWLSKIILRAKENQGITIYNPDELFNNIIVSDHLNEYIESLCYQDLDGFDVITLGSSEPIMIKSVIKKILINLASTSSVKVLDSDAKSFIISSTKAESKYKYRTMSVNRSLDVYLKSLRI